MAMNELPQHILNRIERRWAARLARDAAVWQGDRKRDAYRREIVDPAGGVGSRFPRDTPPSASLAQRTVN
jgi:hypothetical protein